MVFTSESLFVPLNKGVIQKYSSVTDGCCSEMKGLFSESVGCLVTGLFLP